MNVEKMASHRGRDGWSLTIPLLPVPGAVADSVGPVPSHPTHRAGVAPQHRALHSSTTLLGHVAQEYLSTLAIILAEPAVAVGTSAWSGLQLLPLAAKVLCPVLLDTWRAFTPVHAAAAPAAGWSSPKPSTSRGLLSMQGSPHLHISCLRGGLHSQICNCVLYYLIIETGGQSPHFSSQAPPPPEILQPA